MKEAVGYYVTAVNGKKTSYLLGPYRTHAEALANVERGRRLACEADTWAWFYAYGTVKVTSPNGKLSESYFGT